VTKNTVVTTKPAAVPVVRRPRERREIVPLRDTPPAVRAATVSARDWGEPTEIPETSAFGRLVIAYGSNFGANRQLAERFAERSRFYGYAHELVTLNELAAAPPRDEPWLLVAMTSTYTSNPPTNATSFRSLLEHATPGDETWENCRYLVWGLGNSQWNAFLAFPRYIHARLAELGATPLADFAFGDVGTPAWEQVHAEWNTRVWPTLLELSGARPSEEAAARVAAERASTGALTSADSNTAMAMSLGREDAAPRVLLVPEILTNGVGIETVPVRARVCRELHEDASPKRARHLEVELPPGMSYRAGDHLGICPKNDDDRVERLAERLGAALEGLFMVPRTLDVHVAPRGVVLQVRNVLTTLVDLAGPPPLALVELVAAKGGDADGEGLDVLGLLDRNPSVQLNIFEFLQVAQPLRPRYYSTSSSPQIHGEGEAHVAVGLVDRGMCSHYLHSLREGERLNVFLDQAEGFHLQEDVSKPMIFVSAGTGFAPMRAFLWERLARRRAGVELGEAALFNGIRSQAFDYIYREELEQFAAEGALDHLQVVTSREDRCEYVQDRLRSEGALVWRLLDAGAYVYVCGGQAMRDGVRRAFVDVVEANGSMPREHAEAYLHELEHTQNRYRPDLWG
jgi:cytochrome P450/NADPH-cytochrome P450 reductase